jgi:hypothetical protein
MLAGGAAALSVSATSRVLSSRVLVALHPSAHPPTSVPEGTPTPVPTGTTVISAPSTTVPVVAPPNAVQARPLPRQSNEAGLPVLSVGTPVPGTDVDAAVSDSSAVLFGLATVGSTYGSVYPAVSDDDGGQWRVAGPRFYFPALDSASFVGDTIALPPDGALFWGQGGNVVRITTDGGATWWSAEFAYGVDRVESQQGGGLTARVYWGTSNGGVETAHVYMSLDAGRTWTLQPNLSK